MSPASTLDLIRQLHTRLTESYRELVIHSGLPGAARNPLLFSTFLIREIGRKQCSTKSMALSFQVLFCLVPALTLLTSLFELVPGLAAARERLTTFVVDEFLPYDRELVLEQIERFMSNAAVFSAVGVAVLVWGTLVLVMTLNRTLNQIWNIRLVRSSWMQRAGGLGMVAALFLFAAVAGVVTSGPFQSLLRLLDRAPLVTPGMRSFLTGLAIGWMVCFVLYKLVPSTWVRTGSAATAALVSATLLTLAKMGFLAFAGWTTTYTRIYGVIGALFMTLLWVYLAWLIVLAGAVMAFVLQNYEHIAGREQEKMLGERYQTYFATRLLLAVYRAQAGGRSPVSIVQVAQELGLAVYLADRIADLLAERDLLRQVGSSRWEQLEPCLDPEEITLARVATAVSSDPLAIPPEADEDDPSVRSLVEILRGARSTLVRPLSKTTLAELLASE